MKKIIWLLSLAALLLMNCKKEKLEQPNRFCEGQQPIANVPVLISPSCDAVLDNGCSQFSRQHSWIFNWKRYPGATKYQIVVWHLGGVYSLLDVEVEDSDFTHRSSGYIANHNLENWFWKVRAFVDGDWTAWSEERNFQVEELTC